MNPMLIPSGPARVLQRPGDLMLEPGNIDVTRRPVLRNQDGSISTESSFSIGTDRGEVLLPTIVNGRRVTEAEAIEHFRRTGEHLGIFPHHTNASDYAERLHNDQAGRYGGAR